eukprot:12571103-Alexandrium_andersonii.AAC.1
MAPHSAAVADARLWAAPDHAAAEVARAAQRLAVGAQGSALPSRPLLIRHAARGKASASLPTTVASLRHRLAEVARPQAAVHARLAEHRLTTPRMHTARGQGAGNPAPCPLGPGGCIKVLVMLGPL